MKRVNILVAAGLAAVLLLTACHHKRPKKDLKDEQVTVTPVATLYDKGMAAMKKKKPATARRFFDQIALREDAGDYKDKAAVATADAFFQEHTIEAYTEAISRYQGKPRHRFAPFFSHNTGQRAIGCGECHGNPQFLGFGQHVVEGGTVKGTLICEKSVDKPLDGFLTMREGKVKAFSAITRENSRPLNGKEVKRTLALNECLICHDKAADPIYRKRIDYRALDDALHRRLLDGSRSR